MKASSMTGARRGLCSAWVLTALAVSGTAHASANYPNTIQRDLGLATPPACTLCHRTEVGGSGTVVTPFGRSMTGHFGLTSGNTRALTAALAGDDAEHLDADGDGVPDIDELKAGMDPNVGMSGEPPVALDVPLPETGCALLPRSPSGALSSLVVLCVGFAFFGRRSRRTVRVTRE
jgi:hypothetical protein